MDVFQLLFLDVPAGPHLSGGQNLHEMSSVLVESVTKGAVGLEGGVFSSLPKFTSDVSKVVSCGAGLSKAFIGQKNAFTVDCSKAGVKKCEERALMVPESGELILDVLVLVLQEPTC